MKITQSLDQIKRNAIQWCLDNFKNNQKLVKSFARDIRKMNGADELTTLLPKFFNFDGDGWDLGSKEEIINNIINGRY